MDPLTLLAYEIVDHIKKGATAWKGSAAKKEKLPGP